MNVATTWVAWRSTARSMAAWCSSGVRRRSTSSAAAEGVEYVLAWLGLTYTFPGCPATNALLLPCSETGIGLASRTWRAVVRIDDTLER